MAHIIFKIEKVIPMRHLEKLFSDKVKIQVMRTQFNKEGEKCPKVIRVFWDPLKIIKE